MMNHRSYSSSDIAWNLSGDDNGASWTKHAAEQHRWRRPLGSSASETTTPSASSARFAFLPERRRRRSACQEAEAPSHQLQPRDDELRYYLALMRESGMKTMVGAANFADAKIADDVVRRRRSSLPSLSSDASVATAGEGEGRDRRRGSTRLDAITRALSELDLVDDLDDDDVDEKDKQPATATKKKASLLPVSSLLDIWRGVTNGNNVGDNVDDARTTRATSEESLQSLPGRQPEGGELLEIWSPPTDNDEDGSDSRSERENTCSDIDDDSDDDDISHEDNSLGDGSELLVGWGDRDTDEPFERFKNVSGLVCSA